MFVLEQEEYKKEGIEWTTVDFGMDLAATLDLIEKPMGIMSMLEEECIVPKATDMTFRDKLFKQHVGKNPKIGKPKPKKNSNVPDPHFELYHYAGTVGYNVTDWLTKNKDPLNGSVVALFKKSQLKVLSDVWASYMSAEEAAELDKKGGGGGKKRKKGGSFQTVSSLHRESLGRLMTNLRATDPHFVRCIIPNEIKKPGYMEWNLVLHQLRCNGVLEGIRICRKGFPSRLPYDEFVTRYVVLAPEVKKQEGYGTKDYDWKSGAQQICANIDLEEWKHKFGHTKMFFKAGIIGDLEDARDEKIAYILTQLQCFFRWKLAQEKFAQAIIRAEAMEKIQANIRAFSFLKDWKWMQIIYQLKPIISQADEEKKMKELVDSYNQVKDDLEAERKKCAELAELSESMKAEREELMALMEKQSGAVNDLEDRCEELIAIKIDLDAKMADLQDKLDDEDELNSELLAEKSALEKESAKLQADIDVLDKDISKIEKDLNYTQYKTKSVTDELEVLTESVEKLKKEKSALSQINYEGICDLDKSEERILELNRNKSNMSKMVEDLGISLEAEKRKRNEFEKERRKLESQITTAQESIFTLENEKAAQEERLKRCEYDYQALHAKSEDAGALHLDLQRQLKRLQRKKDEIEEELEYETDSKTKAINRRTELAEELSDLTKRLQLASANTKKQVELTNSREDHLEKLMHEIDVITKNHQTTVDSLQSKHDDQMKVLAVKSASLQRNKDKLEADKAVVKLEVDQLSVTVETLSKSKSHFEDQTMDLNESIAEHKAKNEVVVAQFDEVSGECSKMMAEINELRRQIEEKEAINQNLQASKVTIESGIDELKTALDDETQSKAALSRELQEQRHNSDMLRQKVEVEQATKADLMRRLTKCNNDVVVWKNKYETDAVQRIEELEDAKNKLNLRLAECEEQVEQATARCVTLEETKVKLQGDVEDLTVDLDKTNAVASQLEKKQRVFDKEYGEAKAKQDDAQAELETANKEARQAVADMEKIKSASDDISDNLTRVQKKNKKLHTEIAELQHIVHGASMDIHEIEKEKRGVVQDRTDLEIAIKECEEAIKKREVQFTEAQVNLNDVKLNAERKITEQDQIIHDIRRTCNQEIDVIQAAYDDEARSRSDVGRGNKKMDQDLADLQAGLIRVGKQIVDAEKASKDMANQLKETILKNDVVEKQVFDAKNSAESAESRVKLMSDEIMELRISLEAAERQRKAAEHSLMEASERATMLHTQNSSFINQKKKIESELLSVRNEVEEALKEAQSGEESAKKAITTAALLAEDLKKEQDQAQHLERMKKTQEANLKILQKRLDEAEEQAVKGGKKSMAKFKIKLRDLEQDYLDECRKTAENTKILRKLERKLKGTQYVIEEDKKNLERLNMAADKLSEKMRLYKKSMEEATDNANQAMTKFRKVAHELDEANERAEVAEAAVSKARTKAKEL